METGLQLGNAIAVPAAIESRRVRLFRETPAEVAERWTLATAWMLKPKRIGTLPALGLLCLSELLRPRTALPDPFQPATGAGVCGIAHDLGVPMLVAAYRRGLFPYGHCGPVKWMSAAERCVLFFNEAHLAKRLRRQMRQGRYRVTFDRDFERVVKACAGRREGKWHLTWITPRIMRAYAALFDAGYVHSFEVWNEEGVLAGGGYGVALGGAFFAESQFSHEPNTSKIGLTVLNWHLSRWGYRFNDAKWPSPAVLAMGFRTIPQRAFADLLEGAASEPGRQGRWRIEADVAEIADWKPA